MKVRLPLQVDLRNREANSEKDSLITNGYVEESPSKQLFTIKRPGMQLEIVGLSNNDGNGIFFYDPTGNNGHTGQGTVYHWGTLNGATSPSTADQSELPIIGTDDNVYENAAATIEGSGFLQTAHLTAAATVWMLNGRQAAASGFGLMSSDDTMTTANNYAPTGAFFYSVKKINNKFLAQGYQTSGANFYGALWSSPLTGASWGQDFQHSSSSTAFYDVTWDGTQYVALGATATNLEIYTSSNGTSWSLFSTPSGLPVSGGEYKFSRIEFLSGVYVITLHNNIPKYSSDLSSWSNVSGISSTAYGFPILVHQNGMLVYTAMDSSTDCYSSVDGINWTLQSSGISITSPSDMTYFSGDFYLTGTLVSGAVNHIAILRSSDLSSWASVMAGGANSIAYAIDASADIIMATTVTFGSGTKTYTSSDGTSWTAHNFPTIGGQYNITHG